MNSNLFIGFCLFLAACGGSVEVMNADGPRSGDTTDQGGGSATTSTATTSSSSTDTETTSSTSTDTDTTTTTSSTDTTTSTSDTTTSSSSSTSTSTGSAGEGGAGGSVATGGEGGTACTPEVTITSLSNNAAVVSPGESRVATLTFEIAVSDCMDVELATMGILLWTPDADQSASFPFCAGACQSVSDWNFQNLKVVDVQTDSTIEGPGELHAGAQGQPARLDLNDVHTLYAGQSLTLQVVMDIAEPLATQISGMRFQAFLLGVGMTQQDAILTFVHQEDPNDFITVEDDENVSTKLDIALSATTPQSQIVVAGKGVWAPYSEYDVTNLTDEDQEVVDAYIKQMDWNGDVADFLQVALSVNGTVRLATSASTSNLGGYFYSFDVQNPLVIPAHETVMVQVWAKTANVMSSLQTGGAWHGYPRSGHSDSLRLQGLYVASDPSNVAQTCEDSVDPPSMVLRKSKPIIAKQSPSSTNLANIDQDLVKFQVAADSAGTVGVKQISFSFAKTAGVGLTNFRVRKGASDMALADVAFTDDAGADVEAGAVTNNTGMIVLSFMNEESIVGSGNVYTVHATVSGASSGKSVSLSLYRDPLASIVTGYLINNSAVGVMISNADVYNIDTDVAPDGAADAAGTFLWSDNSEVDDTSGGSRDWTNDNLVQGTNLVQVLSS